MDAGELFVFLAVVGLALLGFGIYGLCTDDTGIQRYDDNTSEPYLDSHKGQVTISQIFWGLFVLGICLFPFLIQHPIGWVILIVGLIVLWKMAGVMTT